MEDLERGVYPRSLLDMLVDMEFVSKFRPYRSTDDEIETFINNLGDVSDARKKTLSRYTSFRLTDHGKEILGSSDARTKKDAERNAVTTETHLDEKKGMGEVEMNESIRNFSEEGIPRGLTEEFDLKRDATAPEEPEMLEQELALVEGDRDEDENEDLLQMSVRINQIDREVGSLEKELDEAGFLSKRKIQKQIDELLAEKRQLEEQTKDF